MELTEESFLPSFRWLLMTSRMSIKNNEKLVDEINELIEQSQVLYYLNIERM